MLHSRKISSSSCLDEETGGSPQSWQEFCHWWLGLCEVSAYKQQSVATKLSYKLSKCYYGPFQILQCVGPVAYKLELLPTSMVHVSLLKSYKGPIPPTIILHDVDSQGPQPISHVVIDECIITIDGVPHYQVLV